MINDQRFDLKKRTSKFSVDLIKYLKQIPQTAITKPIITQITRSGTSIGANYFEADNAESKKGFIHKIAISRKETQETIYWLTLLIEIYPENIEFANVLLKESTELNLIFSAIIKKSKMNDQIRITND